MRILYRHKKRGTEYELMGFGKMQAEDWRMLDWATGSGEGEHVSVNMEEVAIYRNVHDYSEIWVRPREEFEDGRFEVLFSEDTQ